MFKALLLLFIQVVLIFSIRVDAPYGHLVEAAKQNTQQKIQNLIKDAENGINKAVNEVDAATQKKQSTQKNIQNVIKEDENAIKKAINEIDKNVQPKTKPPSQKEIVQHWDEYFRSTIKALGHAVKVQVIKGAIDPNRIVGCVYEQKLHNGEVKWHVYSNGDLNNKIIQAVVQDKIQFDSKDKSSAIKTRTSYHRNHNILNEVSKQFPEKKQQNLKKQEQKQAVTK